MRSRKSKSVRLSALQARKKLSPATQSRLANERAGAAEELGFEGEAHRRRTGSCRDVATNDIREVVQVNENLIHARSG